MAQVRKLEAELELASSGDLLIEVLSTYPHKVCKIQPEVFQGCELVEGELGKPGFVCQWSFTLGGRSNVLKVRTETIDKENKIMKLVVVEGDILQAYKSMEVKFQVSAKGEGVNVVKWSLEYEKVHESVPEPHQLHEAALKAMKKIDACFSSA